MPSRRLLLACRSGLQLTSLLLCAVLAAGAEAADTLDPATRAELDKNLTRIQQANDPILQVSPIRRIAELGPAAVGAALPTLLPLLDSTDASVRRAVVHALHPPVLLDAAAIDRLDRLAIDTDDDVRTEAAQVVQEAHAWAVRVHEQAQQERLRHLDEHGLLHALTAEDIDTRDHARALLTSRLDDAQARARLGQEGALLATLARHADRHVRTCALLIAARCVAPLPPALSAAATAALQDIDTPVIAAGVAALAQVAPAERVAAVASVRPLLRPGSPVRAAAVTTLARLNVWDRDTLGAAAEVLGQEPTERGQLLTVLAQACPTDPGLARVLIHLALDATATSDERCLALKALVQAAPPADAIDTCEQVLASRAEAPGVRQGACTALMLMAAHAQVARPLLEGIANDQRERADLRATAAAAAALIAGH